MKKITIGARGSKLSLAYAAKVKRLIIDSEPNLFNDNIEILSIKTSGDIFHDKKLSEIGGKNLFCKEIEESLITKKIDIAVHSLKDMATEEIPSLNIAAYIERNDPRDAFISSKYLNLKELKDGIIGSSSRRRDLQLKLINKDILVKNIRGNIDTRIQKLKDGLYDGIVLALAGIKTLKLEKNIKHIFSVEEMLPAVGQGIIAVQCRKIDLNIIEILKQINSEEAKQCAIAERSLLKTIGGDCDTAVGGIATIENNELTLTAQLFSDSGDEDFIYKAKGKKLDGIAIGKLVGKELLKKAGNSFKKK
ncbi:hydroxymethylbilane synthase [Pelagibacteraceae bacterium]|nr:hydroxymethylbilane synthase [Pelagibacteraceae bacterium]|tara:strand:+ start:1321 stop:2238 length:918 start_codon:yes stop_codon:yes gene_type:complete